jgi:hypothetical protein
MGRHAIPRFSVKRPNRVDHIAGADYGVDYGLVAVFLVWIVLTVALVILLVLRSHAQKLPAVVLPRISPTSRTCVLQDVASGWHRNVADLGGVVDPAAPLTAERSLTLGQAGML